MDVQTSSKPNGRPNTSHASRPTTLTIEDRLLRIEGILAGVHTLMEDIPDIKTGLANLVEATDGLAEAVREAVADRDRRESQY